MICASHFLNPLSGFKDFMQSHGLYQHITQPTSDRGGLIDHIYYNRTNEVVAEVHDTYFSDHDSVFLSLNYGQPI